MKTTTKSAAETRALGERIAARLQPGDVLLLEGGLGAGKSELTRGIAKGLGVTENVTSPSFTILNVYESGRCPLYHFDWYRLESSEELYELGMDEYLGGDGIALVEWPGRCPDAVPAAHLLIRITAEDENTRRIEAEPAGENSLVAASLDTRHIRYWDRQPSSRFCRKRLSFCGSRVP